MESIKNYIKKHEYVKSSIYSFLTGFLIVILANVDHITADSFQNGAVLGLLGMAVRAGVKSGGEIIVAAWKDIMSK